jgi:hypothetical protein
MTETSKANEAGRAGAEARAARMGAAGIVRRGEDARLLRVGMEIDPKGEGLPCCVGERADIPMCEGTAVMEVYGIPMCEPHGEEAAEGALEELYHDARQDLERPLNSHLQPLNPEAVRALEEAARDLERERPALDMYAVLERAFPLERSRVDGETLAQIECPAEYRDYELPSDTYLHYRLITCRLMRLAYEDGAQYLVEALEPYRVESAEQAAFALALEREARMKERSG